MHPVAIKYLCEIEISDWADRHLARIEDRLGWQKPIRPVDSAANPAADRRTAVVEGNSVFRRIQMRRVADATGSLDFAFANAQRAALGDEPKDNEVRSRVRAIRSEVASRYFSTNGDVVEGQRLRNDVTAADLAQELLSYPDCYLQADSVTDTRIVETIQRMQETVFGKADVSVPLRR